MAAAACSTPARAESVIVVDHDRAQRVDDPFVPSRAEIDLGPARGRPQLRAHIAGHGRRAVARGLGRAVQGRAISRSDYRLYRRSYRRARAVLGRLAGARR
ncbi:MAG: hypothetical protein M3417_07935, partial [Actinomycetota bacterium]|nr:hypothetical protein [Actinomycetota bacterium]